MTSGAGLGLYVHWPFCESKCPYCDFNSHVAESIDQKRWINAYRTELEWAAQAIFPPFPPVAEGSRPITSVFFGGGTPSLMEPETVQGILDTIKCVFPVLEDAEITLEANPSSAEAEHFRAYAEAGVNRVSVGVQSLYEHSLISLGRAHDRNAALETIAAARRVFPRYSLDLIYARPGQSVKEWEAELTEALDLVGDHISVYQLTIEPGTAFARNRTPSADEEIAEAMYKATQDILLGAGLPAYEISSHAVPGMESRHNLTYWRGGAYLGIGPGAHSRLYDGENWQASYRQYDPMRWLGAVESGGHGTAKTFPLGIKERRDEVMMMGLRLVGGINEAEFNEATGLSLDTAFSEENLLCMQNGGFLVRDGGVLRATPEGLLRLNAVLAKLLDD